MQWSFFLDIFFSLFFFICRNICKIVWWLCDVNRNSNENGKINHKNVLILDRRILAWKAHKTSKYRCKYSQSYWIESTNRKKKKTLKPIVTNRKRQLFFSLSRINKKQFCFSFIEECSNINIKSKFRKTSANFVVCLFVTNFWRWRVVVYHLVVIYFCAWYCSIQSKAKKKNWIPKRSNSIGATSEK